VFENERERFNQSSCSVTAITVGYVYDKNIAKWIRMLFRIAMYHWIAEPIINVGQETKENRLSYFIT
jgi:hypothetical protein